MESTKWLTGAGRCVPAGPALVEGGSLYGRNTLDIS